MDPDLNTTFEVMDLAVRFDVTNVFDYIASLDEMSRDRMTIVDLPGMVPPFENMWLEYTVSPGKSSETAAWHYESSVHQFGVLLQTADTWHDENAKEFAGECITRMRNAGKNLSGEVRWMVSERSAWSRRPEIQVMQFTRHWFLDETGAMIYNTETGDLVKALVPFESGRHEDILSWDAARYINRHTHLAPLFALSLTHCKNVSTIDAPDVRTRQQRRRDERSGVPAVRFQTLQIDPMKQVLRTEGGSEKNGLKKALHICRGHFAHYSEDKPLFGKYTGTFWRPAHVRGTSEAGTVYKDYKVKAGGAA